MRPVAIVAAVSAFALISIAVGATAASAADPNLGVVRTTTMSYMQPSTNSPSVQILPGNSGVHVRCVTQGQTVNGNNQWYRVGVDDKLGFVPVDAVKASQSAPTCVFG